MDPIAKVVRSFPVLATDVDGTLLDSRGIRIVRSAKHFLEFMKPGVSKAEGLRRILKGLEISMESTIGFGDAENDLEVISAVGIGVAVANASPELKRVASHVTKSNDEDGLAYFLQKAAQIQKPTSR